MQAGIDDRAAVRIQVGRMLRYAGLALALAAGLASAANPSAVAAMADCDAESFARILQPVPAGNSAGPSFDSRAYWLDRRLLKWPGADGASNYKLYHSADAQLGF